MRNTMNSIWRLLCIAAGGPCRWAGFALLAFIIGCQIASIQITLRLIQWSADFYNALQRLDAPAAVTQVGIFAGADRNLGGPVSGRVICAAAPPDPLAAQVDGCGAGQVAAGQGLLVSAAVSGRRQHRQSGPAYCRRLSRIRRVAADEGARLPDEPDRARFLRHAALATLHFSAFVRTVRDRVRDSPLHGLGGSDLRGDSNRTDACPWPSDAGPACGATKTRGGFSVRLDAPARERGRCRIVGR